MKASAAVPVSVASQFLTGCPFYCSSSVSSLLLAARQDAKLQGGEEGWQMLHFNEGSWLGHRAGPQDWEIQGLE